MSPSPGEPAGTRLHVFTNGTDYVVAVDAADAWGVLHSHLGSDDCHEPEEMRQVDDDETIRIWCDADGIPAEVDGDGNDVVIAPASGWARTMGRGFLCSSET